MSGYSGGYKSSSVWPSTDELTNQIAPFQAEECTAVRHQAASVGETHTGSLAQSLQYYSSWGFFGLYLALTSGDRS